MNNEMKSLNKEFQEIKDKMGITAYEKIAGFQFTLYRKIEDLIASRDNWKNKFIELKKEDTKEK